MKIRPVEAQVPHADNNRTDMTIVIVVFHNTAKVPNNEITFIMRYRCK